MVSLKWPIQFGFQLNLTLIQYLNSQTSEWFHTICTLGLWTNSVQIKHRDTGKKTIYLKRIPKKQINVYSLKHKYLRTFFLIFMSWPFLTAYLFCSSGWANGWECHLLRWIVECLVINSSAWWRLDSLWHISHQRSSLELFLVATSLSIAFEIMLCALCCLSFFYSFVEYFYLNQITFCDMQVRIHYTYLKSTTRSIVYTT